MCVTSASVCARVCVCDASVRGKPCRGSVFRVCIERVHGRMYRLRYAVLAFMHGRVHVGVHARVRACM